MKNRGSDGSSTVDGSVIDDLQTLTEPRLLRQLAALM